MTDCQTSSIGSTAANVYIDNYLFTNTFRLYVVNSLFPQTEILNRILVQNINIHYYNIGLENYSRITYLTNKQINKCPENHVTRK